MACGLPIVATDAARVQWIVGKDEFLFGADDPAQIATQIEVARAASTTLRAERVKKAAEFSWAKIAGMYRAFLSEIVSANNEKHRKLQ